MIKFRIILLTVMLFGSFSSSQAAIYWVGDSAACTGSEVRSSLSLALLSAAVTNEADEIRLTATVNYVGGGNSYTLTDWSPNSSGALTISGGYADCFDSQAGRNIIGGVTGNVFTIQTTSQSSSVVTLQNLEITGATQHGVVATGGAIVNIENVGISDNDTGGVDVSGGAYFETDSLTSIRENGSLGLTSGGGIRCTGNNSEVSLSGTLSRNQASSGGGLYVSNGCFAILQGGAIVEGYGALSVFSAANGGGVYVASGGELWADGGASRVVIRNHGASQNGGGMYITGTGRATLLNTLIENSDAVDEGSAIYAINGGTSQAQVVMDRALDCPFLISCSEIQNNPYVETVVYANNSLLDIKRTQIEQNNQLIGGGTLFAIGMVHAVNNAEIRLDRAVIARNYASHLVGSDQSSALLGSHLTVAGNNWQEQGTGPFLDSFFGVALSLIHIENSIIDDTQGIENRGGGVVADCNLVDVASDWPAGSFTIGTPQFINLPGGDSRQLASSPGVDMCLEDSFAWTGNVDLEYQSTPVNENTNPQGSPGQAGGLYDAGADEVYDNIGEDEFLLTVQRAGGGEGSVVSTPVGIACGTDCTEVYFNGTLVTLFANAASGSVFTGWGSCPLANGNECLISITMSDTVTANFEADDLIFKSSFD